MCQGLPGLPVALGHRQLSLTVGKVCSLGLPLVLFQLVMVSRTDGTQGAPRFEPAGRTEGLSTSNTCF